MSSVVIPPAELEQLLAQLLQPQTEAIRQVEAHLRTALLQPAFICNLCELLQGSQMAAVRQLAAVLVRRRIGVHWAKLADADHKGLQTLLLQRLAVEPERIVRRQIASVVSVVARHALPNGTWPELFGFLFECTRSLTVEHRELSMLLLASLLECEDVVESSLRPHFASLSQTLQTFLGEHENPHVRQATLKAVGTYCGVLIADESVGALQPLLAPMLNLCRAAAMAHDEDCLCLGFEIFQEILEEPSSTLIAPTLADLVNLALGTATESQMEDGTRMAALNLMGRALETKRKLLLKQRLVPFIIAKLLETCANDEVGLGVVQSDDDDDDDSVFKRCAQVIHTLGNSMPSKHAAAPLLEGVASFAASPSPGRRRAAIIALAMTAEGFCEVLSQNLANLLPILFAGCRDSAQAVREAACIGLGEFAQHLQPDIFGHYQPVMEHIFLVLNDATEKVKEKSCYALEAMCENVGDDIVPVLEPLIQRLTDLLQTSRLETQLMAISALASVAMAAGENFRPHFETVFGFMRVLLQQTGSQELPLRARALECVGLMNLAVGRECCEPVLHECTMSALAGLSLDLPELREYTYGFLGQLAELVGAEVVPIVPQLLPRLLETLNSEDMIEFGQQDSQGHGGVAAIARMLSKGSGEDETNATEGGGQEEDDEEDDDDDDEDSDDQGGPVLSVRTALLEEKTGAALCVCELAKHAGAAFAPHIDAVLEPLLNGVEYFHPDVRGASARALGHMLIASATAEGIPPWSKGQMLGPDALPPQTRQFYYNKILPVLVKMFAQDDDKDTVAAASEAMTAVASSLGPAAILPHAPAVVTASIKLLKQKHPCFLEEDDGGEDDGIDHDADHDSALWEAVSDLLTTLPKVLGSAWLIHFAKLKPALVPYLSAGHPAADRALAMGILAESLNHLELAGSGFFNEVLPLALRCVNDENETARQNATFGLGILGLYGGAGALHAMQQILTALQPRLADGEASVRDNAVAALGRLVLAFGAALPLASIVPAILTNLPLRADPGENLAAVRSLMRVAQDDDGRSHIAPHLSNFFDVLGELLTPEALKERKGEGAALSTSELQGEIRQFLTWLLGVAPELKDRLPPSLVLHGWEQSQGHLI